MEAKRMKHSTMVSCITYTLLCMCREWELVSRAVSPPVHQKYRGVLWSLRAAGRGQACVCVLVDFISFSKKHLQANPILDTVPRTSQLPTLAHQLLFRGVLVGTGLKKHLDVIVSCLPVSKNSTGLCLFSCDCTRTASSISLLGKSRCSIVLPFRYPLGCTHASWVLWGANEQQNSSASNMSHIWIWLEF